MEASLTSASIARPATTSRRTTLQGSSINETAMLTLNAFLLDFTSNLSSSVNAIGAKAKQQRYHKKLYKAEYLK